MIPLRYTIRGLLDIFLFIPTGLLVAFVLTIFIGGALGSMVVGIVLISILGLGLLSLAALLGYWLVSSCSSIEAAAPTPSLFARYRPVVLAFAYTLVIALVALFLPIPENDAVFRSFSLIFGLAHLPINAIILVADMMSVPSPWPHLIVPIVIYTFYAGGMAWAFHKKGIAPISLSSRVTVSTILAVALSAVVWRAVDIRSRVQVVSRPYGGPYFTEERVLDAYRPYDEKNRLVTVLNPSLTITSDYPRLDGATAAYPLYAAAAQAIYKEPEKGVPAIIDSNTTPQAYERLINGEVDIIFALQPSPEQRAAAEAAGVTLHLTPISKEAFIFFVHQDNPVNSLTPAQIRGIYTKRLLNWSEVGGTNDKILPFQRPQGSGSQTALQEMVMQGEKPTTPSREEFARGMGGVIQRVASYRNSREAIGYSFRFFATTMAPIEGIKLLAIDGVLPTRETIRDGTYPYTAELYAITAGTKNPHAQAFLDWFLSPAGQKLVEDTGYVGITPPASPANPSPAPQTTGVKKDTGRRDDCHDGLLFPPERIQHRLSLDKRKEKFRHFQ